MDENTSTRQDRARGAAIVEMALVSVVLLTLVFGIITYAYMMSFQQSITQAAAEGARAGAVAPPSIDSTLAQSLADAAARQAVAGFARDCSSGAMSCTAQIIPCPIDASRECVRVRITYDYDRDPLLPAFPGLGLVLPNQLVAEAIAEVTEV
ncbi:MAG: TadE/TadG family type IV pilus assembly protein [Acidimicrobiales bacterium]